MLFTPEFKEEFQEAARQSWNRTKDRLKYENATERQLYTLTIANKKDSYRKARSTLENIINDEHNDFIRLLVPILKIAKKNVDPIEKGQIANKTIGTINIENNVLDKVTTMLNYVIEIHNNQQSGKDNTEVLAKTNKLIIEFQATEKKLNLRKLAVAVLVLTTMVVAAAFVAAGIFLAPLAFFAIGQAAALITAVTVVSIPAVARMSKSHGYGSLASKVGMFTKDIEEIDVTMEEEAESANSLKYSKV